MSGRDGAGRWGPSNNEDGRPERGHAVNDGNTRRRDDRNYGYRNDGYYGRGYEQRGRGGDGGYGEQSRPREGEHRARRDDQRHDQRSHYPDDRKDRGQWPRYSDEGEWQCMECGISNYDTDERCARCGSLSRRHHRSMSNADEPALPPPQGPKWPPPFESGGAAYSFHAASGMFYESIADFYYDPKSKLYFGNKSKQYYTYRPQEDPPFCALDAPPSLSETAATGDTAGLKPENKKKIAISLKTTRLPGEAAKANKKPKPHKVPKKAKAPPPEPKKKDAVNIEVWAERGKEIREEAAPAKTTADNKPICLLCRRKFATVEKLKKHEELSSLHKENLEKKRKEDEAKKTKADESGMEYRDRALERRIMHGPAEAASLPALPRDLEETLTTRVAEVVRPEESLGESNIGNVMLQKLGWKSGSSIGRGANGDAQNLVKDWEKIETLASSSQQGYAKQKSRESGIGN